MAIHFQLPVSRRITASVEAHCGAKMYQTSSDSAVARLQLCGQHLADLLRGFLAALDGIDRAERGDRDFARGHARNQRDRDLPVEAERRQHRFDRACRSSRRGCN